MSTSLTESRASASASEASSNCSNGDSSGSMASTNLHFGGLFVTPKNDNCYEMSDNDPWSDNESDNDDEDDYDDDRTKPRRPEKPIPRWAWKQSVQQRLAEMHASRIDPDTIFPPLHPDTCRVELIFGGHRVRARTSSRDWTRDGLQEAEVEQYRRCMKFHSRARQRPQKQQEPAPPPKKKTKKTKGPKDETKQKPSPKQAASPSPERRRPVEVPSTQAVATAHPSSSPARPPRVRAVALPAFKRRPPLAIPLFPLSKTAARRLLLTTEAKVPA
jgi:flagellum-specific peptidoglycan hydrolase FlgJ